MIITDNLIKMFEQAEEIQLLWKPKETDMVVLKGSLNDKELIPDRYLYEIDKKYWNNFFWLPTQEQLQEMVNWKDYDIFIEGSSVSFIWETLTINPQEIVVRGNSLNELWLAFVMHEKYHKTWTGEKWEVVKQ